MTVLSFVQPFEQPLCSVLAPYCRHLEQVPFEGFRTIGKWLNRLRGWSLLLFDRRPAYVQTFPVARMKLPLRRLVQRQAFDLVIFEQLFLVELLLETKGLPALLVEQNVESEIVRRCYAQAANAIHKLRDWLTWRKLFAFERHWVRRFPVCVAVSDPDAALLRAMSRATKVFVVPNGVDVSSFTPRDEKRAGQTLLFFGTLSYGPNVDGLTWFCHQVLPLIRESRPDVRLDVVGAAAASQVLALGSLPGVNIVGFVSDIRPTLWSADVAVVPLRTGGGTRLKILEALAAGCPVVSTTVGAEGLDLVDGHHLLIADNPADFAQAVLRLLQSDDQRAKLSENGRQAVTQQYDWQRIALEFERACFEATR